MKKGRILSLLTLTIGICLIITTGFSAFKLGNDKVSISIPLKQVDVKTNVQNFFEFREADYNGTNKNSYRIKYSNDAHKVITKDTYLLPFSLNRGIYVGKERAIASKTALKIDININNQKLYEHVSNELFIDHDFLKFKVGNQIHELDKEVNYAYSTKLGLEQCFQKNDATKNITLKLPFIRNANGFYLTKVDPLPSQTGVWNLDIMFDFDLLEDDKTYSEKFTYNDFIQNDKSLINFKLEIEEFTI